MSKITYLFGAGASCETMPLVSNLPQRMKEMREILLQESNQLSKTEKFEFTNNNQTFKYDFQKEFIKDFENLEIQSSNHHTIDTYAKKLFATGKHQELYVLKVILSCYFTLEQLNAFGKCDNRYDSFWASLIGQSYLNLPKNVKILSWNYDIQMELSFSEYCHNKDLETSVEALNIHVNNNRQNVLKSANSFGVFKLNGSANSLLDLNYLHFNSFLANNYSRGLDFSAIENVVRAYAMLKYFPRAYNTAPTLSFAWECLKEGMNGRTSFIKVIENEIIDTEVLVVIGYSFPFFNREVDRALLRPMTKLRKVYVQDISPENVISSFRSIRDDWGVDYPNRVEPILMKNQFFLPPEL